MTDKKPAIRNPWDDWTPEPLPDADAQLLAEVLEYAEMIERGEKQLDSVSMQKAEALSKLYQSETWVEEAREVQPPKVDAVGRPPVPNSRNRFATWLRERAKHERKPTLTSSYIGKLLRADRLGNYGDRGPRNYGWTERTIRPLSWLETNGPKPGQTFVDRIPEVEAIAIDLAGSADKVTNDIMRKAVAQFKKNIDWTQSDTRRSKGEQKAKNKVPECRNLMHELRNDDPEAYLKLLTELVAEAERESGIAA